MGVGLEIFETPELETRLLELIGQMDAVAKRELGPVVEKWGKLRLEAEAVAEELRRRAGSDSR